MHQQRLGFLQRLVQPDRRRGEDLLELIEDPLDVGAGLRPQRPHLGAVHHALIEILAELHRLVEQRPDGEIEERLALGDDARRAIGLPEERVATLLQPEQHAVLVVADEPLHTSNASAPAASPNPQK